MAASCYQAHCAHKGLLWEAAPTRGRAWWSRRSQNCSPPSAVLQSLSLHILASLSANRRGPPRWVAATSPPSGTRREQVWQEQPTVSAQNCEQKKPAPPTKACLLWNCKIRFIRNLNSSCACGGVFWLLITTPKPVTLCNFSPPFIWGWPFISRVFRMFQIKLVKLNVS